MKSDGKVWDCKRCGRAGDFNSFLSQRMDDYRQNMIGEPPLFLSKDRGITPQTFRAWNVGWSDGMFMIPADGNSKGKLTDIHRYRIGSIPLSTSGSKKSLLRPRILHGSKRVWITEGEWDGMALFECLRKRKIMEDIYALPGANSFSAQTALMFHDLDVVVLMDNDEAGRNGAKRIAKLLSGVTRSLRFMNWPSTTPDKYDIRDLYKSHKYDAKKVLSFIKNNLEVSIFEEPVVPGEPISTEVIYRDECIREYQKWLHLPDPEILDIVFGTVFANRMKTDPTWMFIVAPPGGSKTEVLFTLAGSRGIVTASDLTPSSLMSGSNASGPGDPSLIPKLNGKTLIIKDFTTILTKSDDDKRMIFNYFREAYDGFIQKTFGNGVSRAYKSKFGIIAGVTPKIEEYSSMNSVLGERFLKYKIKYEGGNGVRRGTDMIFRALENLNAESFMREHLRSVAEKVQNRIITDEHMPQVEGPMVEKFMLLAQWVATLRGSVPRERYTRTLISKPVIEIGTRLAKQIYSLSFGITIFKQQEYVQEDTFNTIMSVAKDTVPDRIEEVVHRMYMQEGRSLTIQRLADLTHFPEPSLRIMLDDMILLGIMEKHQNQWKLNSDIYSIIDRLELYKMSVGI